MPSFCTNVCMYRYVSLWSVQTEILPVKNQSLGFFLKFWKGSSNIKTTANVKPCVAIIFPCVVSNLNCFHVCHCSEYNWNKKVILRYFTFFICVKSFLNIKFLSFWFKTDINTPELGLREVRLTPITPSRRDSTCRL